MSREAVFKKIPLRRSPPEIYRALSQGKPGVLLESARVTAGQGRYSMAAARPPLIFRYQDGRMVLRDAGGRQKTLRGNPMIVLKDLLKKYRVEPREGFPPFAGGAVGLISYEAKKIFEPGLPARAKEDLGLPWFYLQFVEEGVLIDHKTGDTFLFSTGSPRQASSRLHDLERKLKKGLEGLKKIPPPSPSSADPRVLSSVSRKEFIAMVLKAKEYIRRGDIFQANLSQRLTFELSDPVESVYARLKEVNPSSFFGILEAGDFRVLSGSPERLLKLESGKLSTRPIAGTRSRGAGAKADKAVSLELLLNEKERAEHIMLVDLERNDLGRVAEYGTVRVDELMSVENYSHVKHIVSGVTADLRKGLAAPDAFAAFFPGGTITGAPKVRAMEIIDELEPVARGPYTGSLGYFSFTGDMDFNIIIRSLVMKDGLAHLQVGAGIVADSDPEKEYDETLHKAEAVLTAVFGEERTRAVLRRLRAS